MLSFKQAFLEVEKFIAEADFSGNPTELYDPISYSMNLGGKRVRPATLLMVADIFEANKLDALHAAMGVEVFHNFTLVHDDIMDEAPLRRGQDTVYKKWNRDIAILSGDVMFVKAVDYFLKLQPAEKMGRVLRVFNKTAAEVCDGQQMDMNFETTEEVSIPQYLRMIELKTAVLLAASLKIGAIIGKASEEDADNIYEFGKNVGIAFQLQDDYLDAYADPRSFGKRVGGDIIANKKTYLLLEAMNLANEEQKLELKSCLDGELSDDDKVNRVKAVYDQLKIPQLSQLKMKTYFDRGMEALTKVNVAQEKKQPLMDIAEELMYRNI
ncbi:polyprenyl synthetase family protein [Acidiluteibacter ferrifornacis]|uniref:Polyprenyl synthetase family protein n=1 Tax=Acidiluteibacter ferrifornacis TaxID=2692424 RepID=A0A6N9NIV5_9FLAO|nr:polyprenyl synthetase family protein [Acidiluteibacter ferrifornacis]NBG65127.1 polyprenyl synthetase family protein [Acidiluteibacter ferrifornacis]